MTRCPTCYRPEATDEQWKSGACGQSEGGCLCNKCLSVCFGGCHAEHRAYAWTKEPPTEPGWYWVRRRPGHVPVVLWTNSNGEVFDGYDRQASDGYEFLPVPLEVPE